MHRSAAAAAVAAVLLGAAGCSKASETATSATTTAAPATTATTASSPSTSGDGADDGEAKGTSTTVRKRLGSTTTEASDDDTDEGGDGGSGSGAAPLNTWRVDGVKGPWARAIVRGGSVYCSFNKTGTFWQLQLEDDTDISSVTLQFSGTGTPKDATVTIDGPGGKSTAGEGTGTVRVTEGSDGIVSFGFSVGYRDTTPTGGEGGTITGTGSCHQEKPKAR